MLVLVKAIRPTVAGGAHHEPNGPPFYLEEVDAVSLESRGIVERFHEAKMAPPPENKMAEPPENKSVPITTESLKPKSESLKPKRRKRR